MSSSRRPLAKVLGTLALLLPLGLAGCSGLTPVYGTAAARSGGPAFAYAEPADRLSQIVMQDLALRLGRTYGPEAPLITVSASVGSNRALTRTNVSKPSTQYEVAVTVSYSVVHGDETLASGSRSAAAHYTRNSQVLADDSAYIEAQERAARAAGESVRLAILAQLGAPRRPAAAKL